MSLIHSVSQALQGLASGSGGARSLQADDGSVFVRAQIEHLDQLACSFLQLSVTSGLLAGADAERLKEICRVLSQKVTYLLEPIGPIEMDNNACSVQMRSLPPLQEAGKKSYYELLVKRGGEISLCRYVAPAGQPRSVVPAVVTKEVFLRLVGDFASAMA